MLISCASLKSHLSLAHRSSDIPVDAFGLVVVTKKITPAKCVENEKFEICKKVLEELPVVQQNSTGSGLLVWAKNKPVFLTAAHVCGDLNPPEIYYEKDGVSLLVNVETFIHVRGTSAKMHPASILKLDIKNDLCALEVPSFKVAPVKFARNAPKIGDDVTVLSAPFGINAPKMTLIFTGKYSGRNTNWHFYAVPTKPGSSGSVVLDRNYRGIGMLNAAFLDIETVGFGAGHEEISNFLRSIE